MKINENNFPEVFDKYKNTVYSVIFNYLRNTDDSNDILQDVFIKLLQNQTEYENDEHLKAWLIRVAINMSINFLKTRSKFSDEEVSDEIPTYDKTEDNTILDIVMSLPEKYRTVIHLYYYEDYPIKDIASILEIPEATVKIRLKRGREQMKKLMGKEDLWL